MKGFFKYVFATIVGMLILTLIGIFILMGIVGAVSSKSDKEVVIKPKSILHLKLDNQIVDRASDNPFENFNFQTMESQSPIGLNKIIESLDKAAQDTNIKGVFLEVTYVQSGIATVEEIRDALLKFKESGKFIYTYTEILTQGAYYLASVSDKIYLNPVGSMEIKGLRSQITFFKGALEKLGVEPVIFRHGKFKSAIEPFMLDKMSDANKEQTLTFMQSIWDHIAAGIAQQRNMTVEQVNKAADEFVVRSAETALQYGFIDGLKYQDEVMDELVQASGVESVEKLQFVKLEKYSKAKKEAPKKRVKQKIAVIYASGEIQSGKGSERVIGSERISEAIRKARKDSTIKAIVLRVNSPGGSGLASDVIWREAILAKAAKPLVVSMGDLAASGGYYIACPADTIVASPVTLTGSIGVFGLMFNTEKLMNDKLGITFDGVKTNKYADLPNLTRKMREDEKEIIQGEVEEFYDKFIGKVADGRSMTKEAVDNIGQGRVWSGANAKEIGLVDVFGGLTKAIEIAAEMAHLEDYKVVSRPEQEDPFEAFMKQLTGEASLKFIRNELGNENFLIYEKLQAVRNMEGIQARIPADIEIY